MILILQKTYVFDQVFFIAGSVCNLLNEGAGYFGEPFFCILSSDLTCSLAKQVLGCFLLRKIRILFHVVGEKLLQGLIKKIFALSLRI